MNTIRWGIIGPGSIVAKLADTIKRMNGVELEGVASRFTEYALTEISSVFDDEMRGYGPCNASFYEAMDIAQSELESDFNRLSKLEFKEYVGNLKYAEYRCEAICKRLEEIEKEAQNL